MIQEIEARNNIVVRLNTLVIDGGGDYRLERVVIQDRYSEQLETLPAAALFVMIGAEPHTDWLPSVVKRDRSGYIVTGPHLLDDGDPPEDWPLKRMPYLMETTLPGVFAAGDVRHRSIKRVASAVGEGSMAIQFIHQYFMDSKKWLNLHFEDRGSAEA